jgi:hypothetical protein
MDDIKEAVKKASAYFQELLPNKQSVELEAAELSKDEQYWLITLGYCDSPTSATKSYNVITIDVNEGRVVSMKSK